MDHDLIVEHLLDRCKCFVEHIRQAPDFHHVAAAFLASFAAMRPVARDPLRLFPADSGVRPEKLPALHRVNCGRSMLPSTMGAFPNQPSCG